MATMKYLVFISQTWELTLSFLLGIQRLAQLLKSSFVDFGLLPFILWWCRNFVMWGCHLLCSLLCQAVNPRQQQINLLLLALCDLHHHYHCPHEHSEWDKWKFLAAQLEGTRLVKAVQYTLSKRIWACTRCPHTMTRWHPACPLTWMT